MQGVSFAVKPYKNEDYPRLTPSLNFVLNVSRTN